MNTMSPLMHAPPFHVLYCLSIYAYSTDGTEGFQGFSLPLSERDTIR